MGPIPWQQSSDMYFVHYSNVELTRYQNQIITYDGHLFPNTSQYRKEYEYT